MAKLKETYVKDIAPALYKKFGYKSVMQKIGRAHV